MSAGLLLLLPVTIFLVLRKRRRNPGKAQFQKTAGKACTMNTYHTRGKVSEEEDEQVYANVESFHTKDDKEKEKEEEEDDSGSKAVYENCSQPLETEYQVEDEENIYVN
ncbi:hypothetical protein SKAU_G00379900 [Synaphobranchus kaupii]|uniref:Uncharacterized protein n=1 Tax=Synaphobranchus kaupii TaxID=118154 RepID=A0A9Q1EDF6_SYNKA|nr:hypothetical protein SKAU_G00379900 [Synaphobranchus kaupii]